MRGFLERETGLTCICYEDSGLGVFDIKAGQSSVILWDCLETEPANLWGRLGAAISSQGSVVLFNVIPDQGICNEAVKRGVRGIFFEGEPPTIFAKGVQAILDRQLWIPRATLTKCLLENRDSPRPSQSGEIAFLTPREKEILTMIASGLTNGKIANDLCISPNTVKTHIYNIFNKINVPNRLQAALWATKNL
jgi:LuxR family transcriptional regulator of csgAB operon